MPQREYTKTKEKISKPSKRITLAIELEKYKEIVKSPKEFRAWLDEYITRSPELFPADIELDFRLISYPKSLK